MMRYMNCSFSPIEGARLLLPLEPFSMELPPLLLVAAAAAAPLPAPPWKRCRERSAEWGTFSRRIEMATGPRLSSRPNQFWWSEK